MVTVRKESISLAAVPVGSVMDPREMTGALIAETKLFGEQTLTPGPEIPLSTYGSASSGFHLEIANPTTRPVDFTLHADSEDSRWTFTPDHRHGTLPPGAATNANFHISRVASPLDETFRDPRITLEADYLAPGFCYTIPQRDLANPAFAEPIIVANRGASLEAPENTLPSFNLAWKQGADVIEGDFHLTSDGKIIGIRGRHHFRLHWHTGP